MIYHSLLRKPDSPSSHNFLTKTPINKTTNSIDNIYNATKLATNDVRILTHVLGLPNAGTIANGNANVESNYWNDGSTSSTTADASCNPTTACRTLHESWWSFYSSICFHDKFIGWLWSATASNVCRSARIVASPCTIGSHDANGLYNPSNKPSV